MSQELLGETAAFGVAVEHGVHEILEELSLVFPVSILGNHHVLQGPVLKFWNAVEGTFLADIFASFCTSL